MAVLVMIRRSDRKFEENQAALRATFQPCSPEFWWGLGCLLIFTGIGFLVVERERRRAKRLEDEVKRVEAELEQQREELEREQVE